MQTLKRQNSSAYETKYDFFIFYKSKLLHWTMYVTNYNSFETPIVGNKIRGYQVATVLNRLICNFHFVPLRFYVKFLEVLNCDIWRKFHNWKRYKYQNFHFETLRFHVKSNLPIFAGQYLQFLSFWGLKFCFLRKFHIWKCSKSSKFLNLNKAKIVN